MLVPVHSAALRSPRCSLSGLARVAGLVVLAWACGGELTERERIAQERVEERREMVRTQVEARGVEDKRVLDAILRVPRHRFVPWDERERAYEDVVIPVGEDTVLVPAAVSGVLIEALGLRGGERVLEIGTGCGYQAAVLGELCKEVYTTETVESVAKVAGETLEDLQYRNVFTRSGTGYYGWPEAAPFDAILMNELPEDTASLVDQLVIGGTLVAPMVVRDEQQVMVIEKIRRGPAQAVVPTMRSFPLVGIGQRR